MRIAGLIVSLPMLFWIHPPSQGPLFSPAPGSPVRVGQGSGTVIFADVNRDGHLDMLTRHLQSRRVTVGLATGQGGFAQATFINSAYAPADIKLGDVNSDGLLDLAVTADTRDVVEVFLGNGKGAFSAIVGSPFTVSNAVDEFNKRTLHLIDINEDGHLDIVTANGRRRNTFGTLLGNGRGGFGRGPTVTLDVGRDRYWYAFGDLDGDGHLDVVTASSGPDAEGAPGRLLAQSGDGRGTFTPMSPSPLAIASAPGALSLADVNGDHRLDVAVAHGRGGVSVLLNGGSGSFTSSPGSPFNLGSRAFALVLRDVNRDNRPDLVAATVNSITVLLADGQGYSQAPGSPFSAGPGAYNLTVEDMNKDGRMDLAASSFEGDAVTLLLGR